MPYKNPEDKKQWSKNYRKTKIGKLNLKLNSCNWREKNPIVYIKSRTITNWKRQGIISDDWDKTYDYYLNCQYCEWCDEPFDKSANKCLDHDHDINSRVNIRGVLCRGCNFKDYLGDFYSKEDWCI